RLGGLNETRVFKIPGVRRLLKTYGPRDTFTKRAALQLIGGKDPHNPEANFADHKGLFIEPRARRTDLTAEMVFRYLVKKGLFRLGAELACPSCNLRYWIALDALKQEGTCELCGARFDATGQLVDGLFHYRRSGILGAERNMQGAVPVVLSLQQLYRNLRSIGRGAIYFPSYDLSPKAAGRLRACEVDFFMILTRAYPEKSEVVIGECKDEGGAIDLVDVENLQCIADSLPAQRFETYIVFAKLAA